MDCKLDKVKEFASSDKAYRPPKAVNPTDIHDLDEIKLHELREVRNLLLREFMWKWSREWFAPETNN